MKKNWFLLVVLFPILVMGQTKSYLDIPYVETFAKVDTAVTPDKIYLTILLSEADAKGRVTLEDLENSMIEVLTQLGIDLQKQLSLYDLSSNFRRYFLKQRDVLKTKSFSLLVYDAKTASQVVVGLEEINISNIHIDKMEFSRMEELKLELKSEAILKAKRQAEAMLKPLGQQVGKVLHVADYSVGNNSMGGYLAGAVSGITVAGYGSLARQRNVTPEIEFKKIEVESELFAKFVVE